MIRALLLILALLAPATAAAQADQPSGTITIEGSEAQDEAIARRIRTILGNLDGYEGVGVRVNAGVVTLIGEAVDGPAVERLGDLVARVEGVVAIENEVVEATALSRRLNPAVERFRSRAVQIVSFLPLVGVALAVFVGVFVLGLFVSRLRRPWDSIAPNAFIADIYRIVVRLVFLIAGVVLALDILNAVALLGAFLGAAGIVGLAIGFAVRDTVENFIASIMLSIRQPFRPNDVVEIEGDLGKVVRLTSRATILLDFDGNHIRIPNATVFKGRIVNYSRNAERRFTFEIGVDSGADLAAIRELMRSTVAGLPFTLEDPAPAVWIDRIGDGAIFLQVTGWIDQTVTGLALARGESLRLVKLAVEAAGVEVPDTTYRVNILGGGAAQVTETDEPPEPQGPPVPLTPPLVEDTSLEAEAALERLIDSERREMRPDLLSENAAEE